MGQDLKLKPRKTRGKTVQPQNNRPVKNMWGKLSRVQKIGASVAAVAMAITSSPGALSIVKSYAHEKIGEPPFANRALIFLRFNLDHRGLGLFRYQRLSAFSLKLDLFESLLNADEPLGRAGMGS